MSSFYWYDLETFGINPQCDRIAQFAGIRTDLDLNPIGQSDMFYCQPILDMLVDPESCLITGITPQKCQTDGLLERQFIEKINGIFAEPQTCVVGYNSIRFDDEFIRYGNYRNLIDPYMREWSNGNSRWDLIDVIRACYALRPEGIEWPMHNNEKKQPSFKLTDLTEANNMVHTSAHDALSDVEATIQMAKLVKTKQPKLFDYCLKLRNKNFVKGLLNWQILKPIVHVSNKIPAQRGCLAIMLPLAIHPTNANGIICYDLAYDPSDFFDLDIEEIRDRLFTPQADLPEGLERIALKTIHINKSPIVAPLSVLKGVDLDRIQMNFALNKKHLDAFKNQASMIQKAQEVFNQPFDNQHEDVDSMLYSGFFSPQDKDHFNTIRTLADEQLAQAQFQFKDHRATELLNRYIARNHPELLTDDEKQAWHTDVKKRLFIRYGDAAHLWFEKLALLKNSQLSAEQKDILECVEEDARNKLLKLS